MSLQEQTSKAAFQFPQIPSKYDIIPIHNSDRASFKRCRRYWDWSSPTRNNLTIRADVHGINIPMFFGTAIHWALEQYYNPGLRRDPVEAFKTYWDILWRGGVVTAEWLDRVYDLKPRPIPSSMSGVQAVEKIDGEWQEVTMTWVVRGLEDIIPDPDHNQFDELLELGIQMMTFYKTYAAKNDNFTMLMSEHDFSVPIWDFDNDRILTAVDVREESPNFGKTLEVHARGRMDGVWIKPNGKLGIIDHKTAEKVGEEYFLKLDTDEQCTSYLWAGEIEAQYYDLPHKGEPLEEVVFNVLRKAYPKPPTEVRGGMFSVDRTKESCTYDILMEWIRTNIPGVALSEKQQGYVDWLKEVGDEQFIIRKLVRRNRHQLRNAGYRMYLEALDMLGEPRIYPNIRNDFQCINCAFRAPCLAKEDGSDWQQLIRDNYSVNKDR